MDSGLPVFRFSGFENHQSWYALNMVSAGYFLVLIDINFDDPDPVTKFSCYFFQNG